MIRESAESGKPVMFFVHGNCNGAAGVACKTMGKLILRQKLVTDQAKNFHAVEVDARKIDSTPVSYTHLTLPVSYTHLTLPTILLV